MIRDSDQYMQEKAETALDKIDPNWAHSDCLSESRDCLRVPVSTLSNLGPLCGPKLDKVETGRMNNIDSG